MNNRNKLKAVVLGFVHDAIRTVNAIAFSIGITAMLFGDLSADRMAIAVTLAVMPFPVAIFIDFPLRVYRRLYIDDG